MARTLFGEDSVQVKVLLHPKEAEHLLRRGWWCDCHREWGYGEEPDIIHSADCILLASFDKFWNSDAAARLRDASARLRTKLAWDDMEGEEPDLFPPNEDFEKEWEAGGGDWADEQQEKLEKKG